MLLFLIVYGIALGLAAAACPLLVLPGLVVLLVSLGVLNRFTVRRHY